MSFTSLERSAVIRHLHRLTPLLMGSRPHLQQLSPLSPQLREMCCTPIVWFDIKQYEMEKRRRRELEKAGIDVDDDDDAPWIAPEEQQRMDEEEERRRAEEAERVKEMLERRAQEDVEKRKKFKEFRARQLAMSRSRKEARAVAKRQSGGNQRVVEEGDGEGEGEGESESEEVEVRAAGKTEASDGISRAVESGEEGKGTR